MAGDTVARVADFVGVASHAMAGDTVARVAEFVGVASHAAPNSNGMGMPLLRNKNAVGVASHALPRIARCASKWPRFWSCRRFGRRARKKGLTG